MEAPAKKLDVTMLLYVSEIGSRIAFSNKLVYQYSLIESKEVAPQRRLSILHYTALYKSNIRHKTACFQANVGKLFVFVDL